MTNAVTTPGKRHVVIRWLAAKLAHLGSFVAELSSLNCLFRERSAMAVPTVTLFPYLIPYQLHTSCTLHRHLSEH